MNHTYHTSFRCVCPRGYKLDDSGTFCIDKNECGGDQAKDKCGSNSECKNIQGGFQCSCPAGFIFNVILEECVDNNECGLGRDGGVAQVCSEAHSPLVGLTALDKTIIN